MLKFDFKKYWVRSISMLGLLGVFLVSGGHYSTATEKNNAEAVQFVEAPADVQNFFSVEGFDENAVIYHLDYQYNLLK